MNNHNLFYEINRIYGRTALRLIRRHERCSSKLARHTNHLTFHQEPRCSQRSTSSTASSHQRRTQSRWTRIHEIPKGTDQTDTEGQGRCKEGYRIHSTEYNIRSLDKRRQQDTRVD